MGFNPASFDTRKKSDAGAWITLKDMEGRPITEGGKPVQVQIIGRDSAVAKEAIKELDDDATFVAKLIVGWSDNLDIKSASELAEIPYFADQITMESVNRANFIEGKKTS